QVSARPSRYDLTFRPKGGGPNARHYSSTSLRLGVHSNRATISLAGARKDHSTWLVGSLMQEARHECDPYDRATTEDCGTRLEAMPSSRCKQCDQPLVEIDHWGERLMGCPRCNRWQASTGCMN